MKQGIFVLVFIYIYVIHLTIEASENGHRKTATKTSENKLYKRVNHDEIENLGEIPDVEDEVGLTGEAEQLLRTILENHRKLKSRKQGARKRFWSGGCFTCQLRKILKG